MQERTPFAALSSSVVPNFLRSVIPPGRHKAFHSKSAPPQQRGAAVWLQSLLLREFAERLIKRRVPRDLGSFVCRSFGQERLPSLDESGRSGRALEFPIRQCQSERGLAAKL